MRDSSVKKTVLIDQIVHVTLSRYCREGGFKLHHVANAAIKDFLIKNLPISAPNPEQGQVQNGAASPHAVARRAPRISRVKNKRQ